MNIKEYLKLSFIWVIACLVLFSCQKQNMIENVEVNILPERSDEYYANLRAYKQSDHAVYFGWFGGTGGKGSADKIGVLDHIPDSVDIVSLWGGRPEIGSYNDSVLRQTQKVKGTRFVLTLFTNTTFLDATTDTSFIDTYDKGDSMLNVGFEIIATELKKRIEESNLDGLDFDHEPNFCRCDWGVLKNDRKFNMFLKVMLKYFGPLSGTDKLLILDGEYGMTTPEVREGLSYIITQAYSTSSPYTLDNRFNSLAESGFPSKKFIVTENFESYWEEGGVNYRDPTRGVIPSLLGMAYWNPIQGRKGGAGSFHTEYEYALNPDYKYTRQAIQIMNPAAR